MKKVLISFILLSSMSLWAQNLELFSGLSINNFYDLEKDNPHTSGSYSGDNSFMIGLGIDDIKLGKLPLRFTVGYNKYGGVISAGSGGMGGHQSTRVDVTKSVLNFGIYPVNLKLFGGLELNIGFEWSQLLQEEFSGTISSWSMDNMTPTTKKFEDLHDKFSKKSHNGVSIRLARDIMITDKWSISPQYVCYIGLAKEFYAISRNVKSIHHNIAIGIQMKL